MGTGVGLDVGLVPLGAELVGDAVGSPFVTGLGQLVGRSTPGPLVGYSMGAPAGDRVGDKGCRAGGSVGCSSAGAGRITTCTGDSVGNNEGNRVGLRVGGSIGLRVGRLVGLGVGGSSGLREGGSTG